MRLRNPKNDDLGDVIPLIDSTEQTALSGLFLYDGKEFNVQKVNLDE